MCRPMELWSNNAAGRFAACVPASNHRTDEIFTVRKAGESSAGYGHRDKLAERMPRASFDARAACVSACGPDRPQRPADVYQ